MKRTATFCLTIGVALSGAATAMATPTGSPQPTTGLQQLAQYMAPRQYMRRLQPQPPANARPTQMAPATAPRVQPTAPITPGVTPTPPPVPGGPPADPEKAKAQKDEVVRRTIEFQTKRAEAGSMSAQYDLGKRYLTGDGVDRNLDEAKKWFEAAAKQGHEGATAKLEEIKKLEAESGTKPPAASAAEKSDSDTKTP